MERKRLKPRRGSVVITADTRELAEEAWNRAADWKVRKGEQRGKFGPGDKGAPGKNDDIGRFAERHHLSEEYIEDLLGYPEFRSKSKLKRFFDGLNVPWETVEETLA